MFYIDRPYRHGSPEPERSSWKRALAAWLLITCALVPLGCEDPPELSEIRALQGERRFAATIEPLRTILDANPDDAEANYLYGFALVRTGEPQLATWALRKAAENPDWKLEAKLELAALSIRSRKFDEAIQDLDEVITLDPDRALAYFLRGEARLNQGKEIDLAISDFETALELEPTNVAIKTSRAAALLMADRADEAEAAIEELITSADGVGDEASAPRLCATRATLQSERDNPEEALSILEECLEQYPSNRVIVQAATSMFDGMKEPGRSQAVLEKALELDPEAQSYRDQLATRALARGDLKGAEAILRGGVDVESKVARATAWTALTNFYLLVKHDEAAAVKSYEQALANSDEPPALAILTFADLLARTGDHERALAVAADLENDAYRGLIEARVHLNEGRPAEALARLDEVLPAWPNNAGARYYAARAAEQLGDFERAIEEYRQSIRSAADQTEAALRLAKIYLAAGSTRNAWTHAHQHFSAHPTDPEGVRVLVRSAATAETNALTSLFKRLRPTPLWTVAVAERAQSVANARGEEAAVALLEETSGLDLTLPRNAEILRAWVVHLDALDRAKEARTKVEPALAAHPDYGAFHEIHGLLLEGEGAPVAEIRAAYTRSLELDPRQVRALESLGRLAEQEGAVDDALAFYDRATETYPEWPSAARRAAELAVRSGRAAEGEQRYAALLREHPWDAAAAVELGKLRLARGDSDARTLELAERGILFRGAEEDQAFVIEVHRARGESERANELARAFEAGEPVSKEKLSPSGPG